eukprot:CAMPEP_0202864480 /NCGR_PEP_ID=MMETSP1391-20130828/4702_1 /ASSEMBLY_ACC=CAM_ASM_000867 /TAXON_ID=1034604 /ORGANISM="Chlamydomonas leiostraca, Strain SAG 11-49" /LENGTH=124 /DNA_ID=CAMNT_0049544221 /DNA_START=447 /DNA_END=821 /DNA_ORIENTATION=+
MRGCAICAHMAAMPAMTLASSAPPSISPSVSSRSAGNALISAGHTPGSYLTGYSPPRFRLVTLAPRALSSAWITAAVTPLIASHTLSPVIPTAPSGASAGSRVAATFECHSQSLIPPRVPVAHG